MDALSTRDFKKVPLNGSETQGLSSLSTEREKKFVLRRSSKSLTSLITTGEKSEFVNKIEHFLRERMEKSFDLFKFPDDSVDDSSLQKYLKIGIYGAQETGKTCFVLQYCKRRFDNFYIPSLDVEEAQKNSLILLENYQIDFKVYLESQKKLNKEHCHFIFFDLGHYNTFIFAKNIIKKSSIVARKKIILVGNKNDLSSKAISNEEINEFCEKYDCQHFIISVKENLGISALMNHCSNFF